MLESGFSLHGSDGFLFFYEILSGTLSIKVLPGDSPKRLVGFMLRFLSASTTQGHSGLMSILRVLVNNLSLTEAEEFPKYEDDRKWKVHAQNHCVLTPQQAARPIQVQVTLFKACSCCQGLHCGKRIRAEVALTNCIACANPML